MGTAPGSTASSQPPDTPTGPAETAPDWPSHYRMGADGLYYRGEQGERCLCQPFEIIGQCADPGGGAQGLVIAFADHGRRRHTLVMARADLAGGGKVLRQLLAHGFLLGPEEGSWRLLQKFFLQVCPGRHCLLVEKTGWVEAAFVLPDRVIGAGGRCILYPGGPEGVAAAQGGTLVEWQQEVAALAQGNRRMTFALSLAFAAPLLPLSQVDGAIFNLVGPCSSGKSTILHCAATAGGCGADLQSWQVTGSGLEAAALAHNHRLLILDEFAQAPAAQVTSQIYHLTNGRGAVRAGTDGSLRQARQWQTLFLSAGEVGLQGHDGKEGAAGAAGRLTRVIDIPAPLEAGSGLFENLHGRADGAVFAHELLHRCRRFYGTALAAYLERLCAEDHQALSERYVQQETLFLESALPPGSQAQLRRVASRFFLAGFAGELAGRYGVSGWPAGVAMQAAADLLETWLHQFRGYESLDARLVLERVRDFLESEQHRFQSLGSRDDPQPAARPSRKLAGYLLHEGGREHHYVRASVFSKEILRGLDRPTALRVLLGTGILLANPQTAEPFQSMRLPLGTSPAQRVYHLLGAVQDAVRTSPSPPRPAPAMAWGGDPFAAP